MKTTDTDQHVVTGNTEDAEYHAFLQRVNARFTSNTLNGTRPVFTTDADAPGSVLWNVYLNGFPDGERQFHNCSACRHFINRYAGLATIAADGTVKSAVWNSEDAPMAYRDVVREFERQVARARVTGMFVSSLPTWGYPETGVWRHLFIKPPAAMLHKRRDKSAGEVRAEKREDFKGLQTALQEYDVAVIEQAVALLKSETLYRSERVLGIAEWFLALKRAIGAARNQYCREAGTWLSVATAPAGFAHVRTSMIGTLLDDIKAGKPMPDVKRLFDSKMSTYQRAQVAPSAGNIAAAEQLVEKLGVAPSLPRRFARLAELETLWMPPAVANPVQDQPGAVFAHLTPKSNAPAVGDLEIPGTVTMTWEKFRRTLLPEAISIEARMPSSADRFAALVTAADPASPPILQWDNEAARNPVSWYYAGGIDAEIKRRVIGAGGQHADVDIRASLLWNNRNDLDIHAVTPAGDHIYFGEKRGRCGGWLDVDMNVGGERTDPVENIRWARGAAREGSYRFYVQNYRFHERDMLPTPFRVELEVNGEVLHFDGIVSPRGQTGMQSNVEVAHFHYSRDARALAHTVTGLRPAATMPTEWNVAPGEMRKVTAVVESPNLWGAHPQPHYGRHIFFTIEGCRDTHEGRGRGFFTETLKSELRPARSTIEAYTATAVIADADKADACGLGMSDQGPWNLLLRVKTAAGTHHVKVDRFD